MKHGPESVAPPRTQRSRFLRFSLRTLLCFVLLVGAVGLTVKNWSPAWLLEQSFDRAVLSQGRTRAFVSDGAFSTAIWDLEHARKLELHPFSIKAWVYSRDSRFAAVLDDMDNWHLLDLASGRKVSLLSDVLRLDFGAFSPACDRLVGINHYFQFAIFDTLTGNQLFTLQTDKKIWRAGYLEDGSIVALFDSHEYGLFDARTGKPTLSADGGEHVQTQGTLFDRSRFADEIPNFKFGDGRYLLADKDCVFVCDDGGRKLFGFGPYATPLTNFAILGQGRRVLIHNGGILKLYYNRHPEYWWGAAWGMEFWGAVFLLMLFVWSVIRDWSEKRQAV